MIEKEEWRPVVGYEGLYQVRNTGQVRSLDKYDSLGVFWIGKLLSKLKVGGYFMVKLRKDGIQKMCLIHRLVAQSFIANPLNLPQVNHKDEDKTNNNVDNLEWCTAKYNSNYGTAIERMINTKIERGYYNKELCFLDSKERQKLYNKQYQQEHKEELKEYRNKNKEHYKELNRKYTREYRKRKRGQ